MEMTARTAFVPAKREMRSLLASAEKKTLVWLARRMPRWVNSDHLTILGLVAILGAGLSFALARWSSLALFAVPVWLAVNWFGDSLDGTVARVRDQQRPRYGFYVDHVVDAIGTTALVGGMGLSGYMSPIVALVLLVAFLLVAIESYLATYARATFKMSFVGFGPTELRIIIAIGALTLTVKPFATIFGATFRLFDIGGVAAIAGLAVAFVTTAIRNTVALYRDEPVPERGELSGKPGNR